MMKSIVLMTPVLLGLIVPLQAILNAKLGQRLGHPLWGALFNFTIAICCIVFFMIALRLPPPHFSNFGSKHIYLMCGGLVGAIYIFSSLILVPRLGGLIFFSTLIAVQLIASLIYDHFGVLGKTIAITPHKTLGVVLLLLGTALIVKS